MINLKTIFLPPDFNPIPDVLMSTIGISHQRFFHPQSSRKWDGFYAENVGLFTPYRDVKDVGLQAAGIVLKPLIYAASIIIYVGIMTASLLSLPFTFEKGKCKENLITAAYDYVDAILGVVISLISIVTETLFTAIGFLTRFAGPLVNPEEHRPLFSKEAKKTQAYREDEDYTRDLEHSGEDILDPQGTDDLSALMSSYK